jgi:PadR family transcriptional regulator PadR
LANEKPTGGLSHPGSPATRFDARRLTAYGTLYRALARLEQMGLITSAWEDPMIAADAGRPRRRLYSITEDGIRAAADAETQSRRRSRKSKWQEA